MLGDAPLVDRHQRRHCPRRPPELAHAGRTQQELRVAGASALVDVHQLGLQIRQLRHPLLFERGDALGAGVDGGAAAGDRRLRVAHALFLQLPLDFERAQVAKQRARLAREPIGFGLERADAFVHAPCVRFGLPAIGRLRREARAERQRDDAREAADSHVG